MVIALHLMYLFLFRISVPKFYVKPGPKPACIGTLPRKSGSPKVVLPSPPYVVPRIENSAEFDAIDKSCPSQKAQPLGAKFPPNIMICAINGSIVF